MTTNEEHQRAAARLMLDAIGSDGFALAGSGAIREHGVIHRPTEDIDLFTTGAGAAAFGSAVDAGVQALVDAGYDVDTQRRSDQFARLLVTSSDGYAFDVDMGVDWRAHDPVQLDVGPVLDIDDAVSNKVLALYGRTEPRDYLDVDAIRRSGRFTDAELLSSAGEHDPGFEHDMFAQQLRRVGRVTADQVAQYGVDAGAFAAVQARLTRWADTIDGPARLDAQAARQQTATSYPAPAVPDATPAPERGAQRPPAPHRKNDRDTGLER